MGRRRNQHQRGTSRDALAGDREYLTAENDYLVADWSNRFRIEKILPYGPMQFFSTSGELYWFELRPDSNLALFVIQGKDTLGSYQNPVY